MKVVAKIYHDPTGEFNFTPDGNINFVCFKNGTDIYPKNCDIDNKSCITAIIHYNLRFLKRTNFKQYKELIRKYL